MSLKFYILIYLSLFCLRNYAQNQVPPSFEPEDMISLYNTGEIDELLSRAKEIRPSVRGPKWKSMVTEFTLKKADKLLSNTSTTSLNLDDMQKMEEYFNYAHHQNNTQIQSKKAELGFKFLSQYLSSLQTASKDQIIATKKWWINHWSSSQKNPIYALKYQQLFESFNPLSKFENVNILTFFEDQKSLDNLLNEMIKITFKSGLASDLCKNPNVWPKWWNLVKSKVSTLKKKDFPNFETILLQDFSLKCWNSARAILLEKFHSFTDENKFFALQFLSLDSSIVLNDKVFLEIYFLLFKPFHSDLYSKSLERLISISLDSHIRESLVERFSKLDPMPGEVFSEKSIESFEVILRLTKQFPEYIDFYATTCLDYLNGNKKFPNGNPTPNCLDLCRYYTANHTNYFEKPVYKTIALKFTGQCSKTEL